MENDVPLSLAHADELTLTPEERSAVRMALQAKMAMTLSPEEKLEGRRALQNVLYADPAPVSAWSWLRISVRLPATVFSVLLLVAMSGGGLAYAAEGAMPGDALYGVKIYVNEALRAKFQFTAVDRARWAVTRLQRRMDELNRLEARGVASEELDVALGDHVERAAHDVEFEVQALPAAAAERAAMRTAVNAAIGDDQDSLRRASKINRVLKALKERAERFDAPTPTTIAPVPSANARVRATNEVEVRIDTPAAEVDADVRVEADAEADAEPDERRKDERGTQSSSASETGDEPDAIDEAVEPVEDVLEKLL